MNDKIEWWTAPNLEQAGVRHALTARRGGVSHGPYASLNMAFHTGDNPDHVRENRMRACAAVGLPYAGFTCGEQVHGDHISEVTAPDLGRGAHVPEHAFPGTDALISRYPGAVLAGFFADCVPVFLAVPGQGIGLAHAGWKGSLLAIAGKTAGALCQLVKGDPAAVIAAIGPSIGPCCYAVGPDLATAFIAKYGHAVVSYRDGRPYLDLWRVNRLDLERAGVPPGRIVVAEICTACHTERFYSYRAEQSPGRMAALITL